MEHNPLSEQAREERLERFTWTLFAQHPTLAAASIAAAGAACGYALLRVATAHSTGERIAYGALAAVTGGEAIGMALSFPRRAGERPVAGDLAPVGTIRP